MDLISTRNPREPLAIVGIGLRFPGGFRSPRAFWDGLLQGVDAISDVPADRFGIDRFHDPDPGKLGKIRSRRGGFIGDVDAFDADFFGYFPTEAARIDPQQRLALEVAYEALEDAGEPLDRVAGTRTSVFMGAFMYDHLAIQTSSLQRDRISPHVAMGVSLTSISNRISHRLDLRGPSVTVDTACSGSLVAIHLACRTIWNGEADAALAGGVNIILRPESSIVLSQAGFLSPDGRCKAFDASANGYVRSEGVGVVYLKRLSQALADRDRIYALVRGSAVNQDGFTPEGFTVPSAVAQTAMLEAAYADAAVDPGRVAYVEAHGPGTVVGDPIETRALGTVLGRGREDRLWIGSVKTNLGHLEGASGVAGFIKATLVAHNRRVPPNLHFKNPNPNIDFTALHLSVPTAPVSLAADGDLCVGVNSFGAGGTNAHLVLESPPRQTASEPARTGRPRAFVLSARSPEALRDLAQGVASYVRTQDPDTVDLAYSLSERRSRHDHLLVTTADTKEELADRLQAFADAKAAPQAIPGITTLRGHDEPPRVAFAFSGQGGQWARMGCALAAEEPVFAAALDAVDRSIEACAGFSVRREIERAESESRIHDTVIVQPAIFAIQVALARLLAHYGLEADGVVGHSIGEVAAAHVAGSLTLERAAAVIVGRSQIQARAAGVGKMLAVGLSADDAQALVEPYEGLVEIATINGPEALTLAGDAEPLEQIARQLEERSVFARFVNVEVPYHSRFMDPLEKDLVDRLSPYTGTVAERALYSTVTAERMNGDHLTGAYWFANVRAPVRYADATRRMAEDGFNLFIEIGPHPVLVSGTRDVLSALRRSGVVLPAMTKKGAPRDVLGQLLGTARALGRAMNSEAIHGGQGRLLNLPPYPFQRKRHWFEVPAAQAERRGAASHPLLRGREDLADDGRVNFALGLDPATFPALKDHRVDGAIVFPATGHIEVAHAAARELFPHADVVLEDIRFDQPVVLPDGDDPPPDVRLEVLTADGDYVISSRSSGSDKGVAFTQCSHGRMIALDERSPASGPDLNEIRRRVEEQGTKLDVDRFYATIRSAGLHYGESFRVARELWIRGSEIIGHLSLPSAIEFEAPSFIVHPALLDACLHILFAEAHRRGDPSFVYLPHRVERVRLHRASGEGQVTAYVRVTTHDATRIRSDTFVYGANGELLVEILGLTCKRVVGSHRSTDRGWYEPRLQPTALEGAIEAEVRRWIAFASEVPSPALVDAVRAAFPGAEGQVVTPTSGAIANRLAEIPLDHRTHVLLVRGGADASKDAARDAQSEAVNLLEIARCLAEQKGVPALTVLTRGGCRVPEDAGGSLDLAASPLYAAARVVGNELPNVSVRVIDAEVADNPEALRALTAELAHVRVDQTDAFVVLRGCQRYVRKLMAVDPDAARRQLSRSLPARGGAYRLEPEAEGSLDPFIATSIDLPAPCAGEVEIEVHAAGLNFKDVMNAMGLLSDRAVAGGLAGSQLGLEVAGRVRRIGPGVTDVSPGQGVMARVVDGFAGCVVANADLVTPIPAGLSFEEAASLPVVYLTAHYGLSHLARLRPGEWVLIHSGAGGVGAAAIALARRLGAKVLATAGSPERRAYVKELGAEAVFDSRSTAFYDGVMEATGGRGVDVVLNSLAGKLLNQSVRCLAPFGRFVEIGKTDIYRNARLGLERLGDNASFFAVDVDRLASQKPALHKELMRELAGMFERRELAPPRASVTPARELGKALKALSRAHVVGKAVVSMDEGEVSVLPPARLELRADRSYLVTGGTSGFGLEVARFLFERGGRHLVLVSRSGPKLAEEAEAIAELERKGARVRLEKLDVGDERAVSGLLDRLEAPLAGIVHAAAVLDDGQIPEMTAERFERVFRPKAVGAWNLHQQTTSRGSPLDFFVSVSSISSVLGLYGQFGYAAANEFLDGLAAYRQTLGMPGTSVNLGVLGEYAGMSRRSESTAAVLDALEAVGLSSMTLPETLSGLENAILHGVSQRMVARVDWRRFGTGYPHLLRQSEFIERFATNQNDANVARSAGLRESIAALPKEEQAHALATKLRDALARIVGIESERISIEESIDRLALDSLTLVQLRSFILREWDVAYPLIRLMASPCLLVVAEELLGGTTTDASDTSALAAGVAEAKRSSSTAEHGFTHLSPWIVRGQSTGLERVRVVCFHAMGASASLFAPFLLEPPQGTDVLAVQSPGRETRAHEPFVTNVADVVSAVLDELEPLLDRRFVFWGHSFGGIVAFEAIRELTRRGGPVPEHLLVTGSIAPQLVHQWQRRGVLLRALVQDNSPEYLLSLARYVENAEFVRSVLPLMRKDAPILLGYRYDDQGPLPVPVTAFAARQDDMVYVDEVEPWQTQTRAPFRLVTVEGDHWFLHRHRALLRTTLGDMAARAVRDSGIELRPGATDDVTEVA